MSGERGPSSRPLEFLKLCGSRRVKNREPDRALPHGRPTPPKGLSKEGKKEFRRIVRDLEKLQLGHPLDRAALALFTEAWVRWCGYVITLATQGETVELPDGQRVPHPAAKLRDDAAMLMIRLMSQLGMTPAARARLGFRASEDGGAFDDDPYINIG